MTSLQLCGVDTNIDKIVMDAAKNVIITESDIDLIHQLGDQLQHIYDVVNINTPCKKNDLIKNLFVKVCFDIFLVNQTKGGAKQGQNASDEDYAADGEDNNEDIDEADSDDDVFDTRRIKQSGKQSSERYRYLEKDEFTVDWMKNMYSIIGLLLGLFLIFIALHKISDMAPNDFTEIKDLFDTLKDENTDMWSVKYVYNLITSSASTLAMRQKNKIEQTITDHLKLAASKMIAEANSECMLYKDPNTKFQYLSNIISTAYNPAAVSTCSTRVGMQITEREIRLFLSDISIKLERTSAIYDQLRMLIMSGASLVMVNLGLINKRIKQDWDDHSAQYEAEKREFEELSGGGRVRRKNYTHRRHKNKRRTKRRTKKTKKRIARKTKHTKRGMKKRHKKQNRRSMR